MNQAASTQVTQVRITSPFICEVHGWVPGQVYPTLPHEIDVPDINGQQVHVHSNLRNRSVWLSESEYELVESFQA